MRKILAFLLRLVWPRSPRARAIMPLLTSICILLTGTGILTTIVSLHLSDPSIDTGAVQMTLTAYPVGFLVGCLLARPLVKLFGHERTYLLVAFGIGLAATGLAVTSWLPAWFVLRFVGGLSISALFIVAESWINLYAAHTDRGHLFGLYMISTTVSGIIGQLLLEIIGPRSPAAFGIAAAIIFLGAAYRILAGRWPSLPDASTLPDPVEIAASPEQRYSFWRLAVVAPVTVVAIFQSGMTNLNVYVMTPIYGPQIGLSASTTVGLVTALSLGGMLAQSPVGWLSDRYDRRLILLAQGIVALALCAVIAWVGRAPDLLLFALFFAYGGTVLTIYPVALAFANSQLHPKHMVAASGALLFLYSIGNVLMPGFAAGMMQAVGPHALFLMLGSGAVMVVIAAFYNLGRRVIVQGRAI